MVSANGLARRPRRDGMLLVRCQYQNHAGSSDMGFAVTHGFQLAFQHMPHLFSFMEMRVD
jgi:hypothetical protein